MSRAFRTLLLSITTVLTLVLVLAIAGASYWYIHRLASERSGRPYVITATGIERGLLGLYLRAQGDVATAPVDPADTMQVPFVIDPGESVTSVSLKLEELNLVADAEVFRRVVQYHGADADIQVGTYLLSRNMNMEEIMRKLQRGLLPSETVAILEGWRMEQVAEALEIRGITSAEAFLALVSAGVVPSDEWPYLTERPVEASVGLEGFLFPDTYQFVSGTAPEDVLQVMLRNFDWRLSSDLRQAAEESGMSLYEIVTLASIVEREAVAPDERPIIASVFLNRLDQGMPLQADPTVQYALGCDETGNCWQELFREDLNAVQSPYNTYLNPGLPPGPICNPGLDSIRAVLEPGDTRYLYFVATDDGRHLFAETYEEHLRNDAARGGQ
jgi:UPF0755 protein